MVRRLASLLILLQLAALAWGTGHAFESAPKPWSQPEARALGHQLAAAVNGLDLAVRDHGADDPDWKDGVRPAFRNTVAMLTHQAKSLRIQLMGGVGRSDTAPIFDQIEALAQSLQIDVDAGRVPSDVGDALHSAREAAAALAPYYERSPAPNGATGLSS